MSRTGRAPVQSTSTLPGVWPHRVLKLATRALPAGPVRDRYRREFVAELYGMDRRHQTRHAVGILSRSWALRAAVSTEGHPVATASAMTAVVPRTPLLCRLNLHHSWVTMSAEDGSSRYRQCRRCGKDDGRGSGDSIGYWMGANPGVF